MGAAPRGNNLIAFMIVGLGMLLIAGLGGVVLWAVTRRRQAIAGPHVIDAETLTGSEPAEAK